MSENPDGSKATITRAYSSILQTFPVQASTPAQRLLAELECVDFVGRITVKMIEELRPKCRAHWDEYFAFQDGKGGRFNDEEFDRQREELDKAVVEQLYPQLFGFCDLLERIRLVLPDVARWTDTETVAPKDRFTVRLDMTIQDAMRAACADQVLVFQGERTLPGCPSGNLEKFQNMTAALDALAKLHPEAKAAVIAEAASGVPEVQPHTEGTVMKVDRVFGTGDHGDAKPPALPADLALTTDHESILAVLGKTPTKCKTVLEVSSAGTIRNRETVGRLLRELAGFGMVDRPHGKRKGYALTAAGRKRMPGASPT